MTQLLLSGLHASSACGLSPFPGLSVFGVEVSYLETNWVRGTIPACLLSGSLPALSFLALSGNLLTGTVSRTATIASTLTGLDLSHNALTGTIPAAIVEAELSLLDLSFNRLSGTIASTATSAYATAGTTAQVSLAVNLLSGALPRSWEEAVNIDVLKGNLFACAADSVGRTAHLPVHDPLASTYACGSSLTNVSLIAAVVTALVAAVVFVLVYVVRKGGAGGDEGFGWADVLVFGEALRSRAVEWVGVAGWRGAGWMAVYLATSLVVYAVSTVTTSVYAETYVWVVSMSLQEGSIVGSVLLVWVGVLCAMVFGHIGSRNPVETADDGDGTIESATKGEEAAITSEHTEVAAVSSLAIFGACVSLLMVHILPVLVIDIAYVYSTTLSLSTAKRAMIVVAMSLYKMTWNALLGAAAGPIERLFVRGEPNGCSSHSLVQRTLVYACMINMIITPTVTEMLVSPNCFQYLFSAIPAEMYTVNGGTCYWISYTSGSTVGVNSVECMSYDALLAIFNSGSVVTATGNYDMVVLSTTSNGEGSAVDFRAGFAYNFQCAFSLLEAFVYVFVYKYVCRLVVLPWLWVGLKQLQRYSYRAYGPSSRWLQLVNMCLPPLLQLMDEDVEGEAEETGQRREEVRTYNTVVLYRWQREGRGEATARQWKLRVVSDMAVMVSFGQLFPLLGLLTLAVVLVDFWSTQWMVGRLRQYGARLRREARAGRRSVVGESGPNEDEACAELVDRAAEEVEAACLRQVGEIRRLQPTLLCYAAFVWSLALYDIVGREVGSLLALWIMVVALTMPWWMDRLFAGYRLLGTSPRPGKAVVEITERRRFTQGYIPYISAQPEVSKSVHR
eukprot:gene16206-18341_t